MKHFLVLVVLLITNIANAGDCCFICTQQPQYNDSKVKVITRLIGFSQPSKSNITLEEQFANQLKADPTLEPHVFQNNPVPLRRFEFQKNTPDHTPRPAIVQRQESVQYTNTTQFYSGFVEVPVTIHNGQATIESIISK